MFRGDSEDHYAPVPRNAPQITEKRHAVAHRYLFIHKKTSPKCGKVRKSGYNRLKIEFAKSSLSASIKMLQLATNRDKFKPLVHYICWRYRNDPSKLGAVKLNKALWLSDLAAFYYLGKPITRARYVKRKFGPTPKAILPVLRELSEEGKIDIKEDDYYGKKKKTFVSLQDASDSFLSEDEKNIVEKTMALVCEGNTAKSISEQSHDHIWKAAADGEELPLSTVFVMPDGITTEDREWARRQLEAAAAEWRSVA
jgi:hypothetical protein